MTDKELLELAAKAAGIDAEYNEKWGGMLLPVTIQEPDDGVEFWNPLTDDGDALRLAVKCGINVFLSGAIHHFAFVSATHDGNYVPEETDESMDINAATRRAIVRAAAEIGKDMT